MAQEEALEEFLRLAQSWSGGYQRFIRSMFALKHDGEWHLQLMMTVFVADFFDDPEVKIEPIFIETDSILAVREVVPFNDSLIDGILNGDDFRPFDVTLSGYTIKTDPESVESLSYYFEPWYVKEFPSQWRRPALTASGRDKLGLFHKYRRESLDLELLGNEIPYESINDLLFSLGLPLNALQGGQSIPQSTFIVSTPAIVLEESSISGDKATAIIRCKSDLDRENISLSVRAFNRSGPTTRFHIPNTEIGWEEEGNWATGTAEIELSDNPYAAIHLSYGNEFLGAWFIRDAANSLNNRLLVHKVFHNDDELLNALISEQGNLFETATTALFSLLGLNCVTYGALRKFKEGPDVIAYSDAGHLYVIECKGGSIKEGKLHELSLRCEKVSKAVREYGMGIQHVLPVLVTNLPRHHTKAKWDEAAKLGISIVCQEELKNLVAQLEFPPAPQVLYERALASIPPEQDAGNQGLA